MKYISIDGDDVGRKITSCYLSNDQKKLELISSTLEDVTLCIADILTSNGFQLIFRAADGVVAKTEDFCDFKQIFYEICSANTSDITFSAGVGSSLKEAYIALLSSKCNGKNKISIHNEE